MDFELPNDFQTSSARILDAGGWFIPFIHATHVVDLMPYETRTGKFNPAPLPGERFSKDTWTQADFMDARFRLPFPDKFFDFSVCGHTVEDLENPGPLLAELRRVSRAGYIETPSRLSEQTRGSRDRMTSAQGHPHHHWIVEAEGNQLLLSSKKLSLQGPGRLHGVPLLTYEAMITGGTGSPIMRFQWQGDFEFAVLPDDEVVRRAHEFVSSCPIAPMDRVLDPVVRKLRGVKRSLLHATVSENKNWWADMLTLSRPFSTIPL
jgi:SAM-dependent methyltransferase